MIKKDLAERVARVTGTPYTTAELAVDTILLAMREALKQGDRIELRGFGVFTVRPRKSGVGRNPRTGETKPIPPGRTVKFKPGKELRVFTESLSVDQGEVEQKLAVAGELDHLLGDVFARRVGRLL